MHSPQDVRIILIWGKIDKVETNFNDGYHYPALFSVLRKPWLMFKFMEVTLVLSQATTVLSVMRLRLSNTHRLVDTPHKGETYKNDQECTICLA